MPSSLSPLSRSKSMQLFPLAARLNALFEAQEDLPRDGPVPAALRGEALRVFNGIDRLLPPGARLAAANRLRKSRRPEMFDLFRATLESIGTINALTRLPKIPPGGTCPRAEKQW